MRSATLTRISSGAEGTFGNLITDNGMSLVTLELPWQNDAPNISCIPPGNYLVKWTSHPLHGWVYQVENVLGRSAILIHSANIPEQLLGCIAVGTSVVMFPTGTFPNINIPIKGIQHSKQALTDFDANMNQSDVTLTIRDPL